MLHFVVSDHDREILGYGLEILQAQYTPLLPDNIYNIEVSLVDADEIQRLNSEYRQINQPTDVLSFPLYESTEQLPTGIPCLLGNIVICPEQVEHYHETLLEMVHHGIIHLLGADHETDRHSWDVKEQEALQYLQCTELHINAAPR